MYKEIKIGRLNISNRRAVILTVVSAFLTIAIVFGYQIENYSMINIKWSTVVALLCGIIITFWCLCMIFYFFDFIKLKRNVEKNFSKGKTFLFIFGIIIIVYFLNFLALYPGLFVFDASWQWDMYKGNESLSEHHPILHTLLMGRLWIIFIQ